MVDRGTIYIVEWRGAVGEPSRWNIGTQHHIVTSQSEAEFAREADAIRSTGLDFRVARYQRADPSATEDCERREHE